MPNRCKVIRLIVVCAGVICINLYYLRSCLSAAHDVCPCAENQSGRTIGERSRFQYIYNIFHFLCFWSSYTTVLQAGPRVLTIRDHLFVQIRQSGTHIAVCAVHFMEEYPCLLFLPSALVTIDIVNR